VEKLTKSTFVAIDFETATGYRNSACSVGIVSIKAGKIVDEYHCLIQPPENEYWDRFIDIHGIQPEDTEDAPNFAAVWGEIAERLKGKVIVAHNAGFDRSVLFGTAEHYGIDGAMLCPPETWFCTMRHFANEGYPNKGLAYCCEVHSIELNHHDVLSDARACAQLALLARSRVPRQEGRVKKLAL